MPPRRFGTVRPQWVLAAKDGLAKDGPAHMCRCHPGYPFVSPWVLVDTFGASFEFVLAVYPVGGTSRRGRLPRAA